MPAYPPPPPLLPADARAQLLRALRDGRLDDAEALCTRMRSRDPYDVAALHGLGLIRCRQGRADEAVGWLRQAIVEQADSAALHCDLGGLLHAQGRHDEALGHILRAIALAPGLAAAHSNHGGILLAQGHPEAAVAAFERALALAPDQAELHYNLGRALTALGHAEPALACYDRALRLAPDNIAALTNRGGLLVALDRPGEAVAPLARATSLAPNHGPARINLGSALQALGRGDEAAREFAAVIAAHPADAAGHANLGILMLETGDLAAAEQALDRAVTLAPGETGYWRRLGQIRRFAADGPELAALEALAAEPDALDEDRRIDLHYALGKALADLDRREEALDHLRAGGSLVRRRLSYDEAATLGELAAIRAAFPAERFAGRRTEPAGRPVPVFVFGMPRSGTTLVEQILAAHPAVAAAGERADLHRAAAAAGFPAVADASLTALATGHAGRLAALAPEAGCVVDKTPAHFRFAGLIALGQPQARMIHTARDPLDTCLSCFSVRFAAGQEFTYDLGELGRYYRAYAELMDHWRRVLPGGAMLEIRYEDLVADLEGQARRILAHCGLDWHPACLEFHRVRRPVRTASAAQVRRPLYRDAVGRAASWGALLHPLEAALSGASSPGRPSASSSGPSHRP